MPKITTTKYIDYEYTGEPYEWDGEWDILADGALVGRAIKHRNTTYPAWHGFVIHPTTGEKITVAWTGRKADIVNLAKNLYTA